MYADIRITTFDHPKSRRSGTHTGRVAVVVVVEVEFWLIPNSNSGCHSFIKPDRHFEIKLDSMKRKEKKKPKKTHNSSNSQTYKNPLYNHTKLGWTNIMHLWISQINKKTTIKLELFSVKSFKFHPFYSKKVPPRQLINRDKQINPLSKKNL